MTELASVPPLEQKDPQAAIAHRFGLEICSDVPLPQWPKSWKERITYDVCRQHHVLPLRQEESVALVAVANPLEIAGVEALQLLLELEVRPVYCAKTLLSTAIQETFGDQEAASQLLADLKSDAGLGDEEARVYDLLDSSPKAPIVRILNAILTEAIQMGASDIHFEPLENDLRVRYRVDGVLQTRHAPPRQQQSQLLARLKVMARLDIAEHRLPQDGRIKLKMGGREIDFRVSTIPVSHGERIVLRILDRSNVTLGLQQSGMSDALVEQVRSLSHLPEGILLVTGPTGSGKTTTLYSALSERNTDAVNIMTVEDPVEYKLSGIAQINVRPQIGLTFASGLRHILRQDPDVVMVGEIRDHETAQIAVQASLTGHFVLSTLHTNDASSALTRLVDMGIEPYLLSSSVVGVLAQRLVRTICPDCKEAYQPNSAELADLNIEVSTLYRGRGCDACYGSGYRGRLGIFELMKMRPALRKQVVLSAEAGLLRQLAIEGGMQTLMESGTALVTRGMTTVSEVLRVTRTLEME